jgi:hypothetical protein
MTTPHLDILKRTEDGSFVWMEAANDLSLAKARMQQLLDGDPGEYFIFDQRSQQIVAKMAATRAASE